PATLSSKDVQVIVEDLEKLSFEGKIVETYRLRQEYADTQTFTWVDTKGRVLKEEALMGLSIARTTAESARSGITGRAELTDVIAATVAPANRNIKHPRETRYLKARLKGVDLKGFELEGGRQKLDGDIVEITRESINPQDELRVSPTDPDFKKFLIPISLDQTLHPKILARARAITGGDPPLVEIRKVTDWVFSNLEKRPTMSVPDPVTVLDTKVGDCKEHAALAAALLQALGIPVKLCAGVLFFQDGFYYHAWIEVFWGQWLAVDPLLNQIPADATHIRFLTGGLSRQTDLIRLIGRLEIEILAVE
ncbi:MAG: transglutaminase domain-containing protein, partial [Deltaproteobacteria bacterium]|nr:transglutaminase domain-containing protein [Deltaproteobacteria bacterium]